MSTEVFSKKVVMGYIHHMDNLLRNDYYLIDKHGQAAGEYLLSAFLEIHEQTPENAFLKINIARLLLTFDQPTKAITILEQGLVLNPSNKFIKSLLALAYFREGQVAKAVEFLRTAKVLGQGMEAWAPEKILFDGGEQFLTEAVLGLEVEKLTKKVSSLYKVASTLEQRGFYEQAIECHLSILKELPEYHPSLCNIATSYWKLGKISVAKNYYQQALKLEPTFFEVLRNLTSIHFKLEEYELAVGVLKQAVKTYPTNPDFLIDLGTAYAHLKHEEKAVKYLKLCLEIAPEYCLEIDHLPVLHPILKHLV